MTTIRQLLHEAAGPPHPRRVDIHQPQRRRLEFRKAENVDAEADRENEASGPDDRDDGRIFHGRKTLFPTGGACQQDN